MPRWNYADRDQRRITDTDAEPPRMRGRRLKNPSFPHVSDLVKSEFAIALVESAGCLRTASRRIGVDRTTIRRWRLRDPAFDDTVRAALELAGDIIRDELTGRALPSLIRLALYADRCADAIADQSNDALMRLLAQRQGIAARDARRRAKPPTGTTD